MDLSNIISTWVEKACGLPFSIETDIISDEENDGACLRYDPAPAAVRRFGDGSRLITQNLTFYFRCKSAAAARAYGYDVTNRLDGETIENPQTGIKIEVEAQTLPQYIEVDDKLFTTYSAAIICTYLEEDTHGN